MSMKFLGYIICFCHQFIFNIRINKNAFESLNQFRN